MCGIVGAFVFGNSNFTVTSDYLVPMRDAMAHRGPDGAGLWISRDRKIGLGHRRLSIIDLSDSAAQPMSNPDNSLFITYNGEIYNHAEIRSELIALGHTFWKTDHSDTEVVLRAFEHWGIDCLEKFRGMFAFAIWDAKKKELWLVRDRIGVKPLYYSIHHGRIVFASEIKAILKDPDQSRSLNEHAFYHYLSFLIPPAPETLFERIQKLPAGSWLRVSTDGTTRHEQYWDVLDHTIDLEDADENEIAERIITELRDSVRYRKVSDVPVGVFLSGGIDSSTNAVLFSENEKEPVKTFTIGYEGEYKSYKNETVYARMMADLLGATHRERLLTIDDFLEFMPEMVRLQDEPIGDPVCFPVYFVSKLARDNGVIVCQVGEGADELFCGYDHWKTLLKIQRWDDLAVPRFIKSIAFGIFGLGNLGRSMKYEWIRRGMSDSPIFWGGVDIFTDVEKKMLLSDRLRSRFRNFTSWESIKPIHDRFIESAREPSNLNWMTYVDLRHRLPELLLMRVDKMSMGVSLETRVPFLDHKFVELAMSIPEKIKTRNNENKYILKKAVRGIIPDRLIDRKKVGFGVPMSEWFMEKLGSEAKREILGFCEQTDYLDRTYIARLIEEGDDLKLWTLMNFVLWWKEYMV